MAETARTLPFDVDDPLLARAAWSRLTEPGDEVAGALVAHLGAPGALAWLLDAADDPERALARHRSGTRGVAERGGQEPPDDVGPVPAVARLARAVARWAPRLDGLDPRRELRVLHRLGGSLVVPGDPRWPRAVDDLGARAPLALWVRGVADLAALTRSSVAVVGARACTEYGRHVTHDLASGLVDRGITVVSGGAYGIDAAAHRAALVTGGRTVAVLAGGVDRLYPAGNTDLLRGVLDAGGAVVSEVPPGSVPSRVRFLLRNRLIAAVTGATVVVEAAWRSGAISTATHAATLGRPVGAVPGPVTSMASSGCHRLLRDGAATCVTDAAEVVELAGRLGVDGAPEPVVPAAPTDDLDEPSRRLWDALPLRSPAPLAAVARAAGLSPAETLGGLGLLELRGLAEQGGGGWRRGRPEGAADEAGRAG